jgi:hypothetical protein
MGADSQKPAVYWAFNGDPGMSRTCEPVNASTTVIRIEYFRILLALPV